MLDRPRYYRRDGTPIPNNVDDVLVWAESFERANRRVCCTNFWWGGRLSTVFLGLDHAWGNGPPLIFETMLFGLECHGGDLFCDRYSTEKEAIAGHSVIVRKLKNPFNVLALFIEHFRTFADIWCDHYNQWQLGGRILPRTNRRSGTQGDHNFNA